MHWSAFTMLGAEWPLIDLVIDLEAHSGRNICYCWSAMQNYNPGHEVNNWMYKKSKKMVATVLERGLWILAKGPLWGSRTPLDIELLLLKRFPYCNTVQREEHSLQQCRMVTIPDFNTTVFVVILWHVFRCKISYIPLYYSVCYKLVSVRYCNCTQ